MTDQPAYKWTVHDFTDKSKRRHFVHKTGPQGAVEYANALLAKGHRVKIFPYSPPRRYIDIVAERGPDGPVRE